MKRREQVAVQIRATLANGGTISGATLVSWAKTLDPNGAYHRSDDKYRDRTFHPGRSA